MDILNYINKMQEMYGDQASLADDLEPGALKDEMLKDFDPSQETYEEYLQRKSLERPFNMAQGGSAGQLVTPSVDGSRPGYAGRNRGIGKGSPGVPKTYETVRDQLYTEETKAKKAKTNKLKFQATPVGERLQWIANNGKNYNNPETFIKAYEKHFKHKIGSKTDILFNTSGKKPLTQVDNLINTGRDAQDLFTLKKGFNEEELFKASIIQNNPEIKKEFKTLFKQIHNNVSEFSELGPEGIVERLNKGKLLNDFDFIKSTVIGNREIGGVHSGITRNSLLNAAGVPTEHLTSYQSVRKPLMAVSQIIENLKNPSKAKEFGISPTTATKIRGQLENFLEGEKNLRADIKKINNQLGDVKFNNIFGGVNFEHTLAKQFGKDYKYLPRNYLLKGQFTSQAFNMIKKDAFDLPLIRLMKQYEQGKVSGAKVQEFIDNFNAKTNNYVDFRFDPKANKGKGGLSYLDNKVSYDLSRYKNPGVARDELVKNIELTMSPEFQKGMKQTVGATNQLKLFKSQKAKDILQMLKKAKIPCIKGEGGQCTSIADYTKGYNKLVQEGAEGSKAAITKLGKFTKGMRAFTGAAKWTGYGLLAEVGFMVPFAIGDYAAGESWKRILGNATDYGFGPIFGQSEQEEFEAALPEGSAAPERRKVYELGERLYNLENQPFMPQGRIGMDKKRREESAQKVYDSMLDEYFLNLQPFMTGPAGQYYDQGLMDKAEQQDIATMEKLAAERQARIDERTERGIIADQNWQSQIASRYAGGGIVGLSGSDKSGPPPTGGPMSQGLRSLYNNGKKL